MNQTITDLDPGTAVAGSSPFESVEGGVSVRYTGDQIKTHCLGNAKVYRALVNQISNGAPSAVVLENTVGTIVWTRDDVGEYSGTLTGAFVENRTFLLTCALRAAGAATSIMAIQFARVSANVVKLYTFSGGEPEDGVLVVHPVQILVYP